MKLFVNRNDIMKMLCERHGIATDYNVERGHIVTKYGDDEVCWEGSEEHQAKEAQKVPKK